MTNRAKALDLVCIGRSSVDLYGEQIGTRLEDVASFAKYVGGCPTNIAVGAARLGLRSALITRVGDEQLGSFIIQTLESEGVDVSQVSRDPERLTALVILGIRDQDNFPHIFYRPDCADMALNEEHIDEAFIARCRTLLVSGTHFSTPGVEAASREAMRCARAHDVRVVLDIDYRPSLWGLAGHASGENRFIADPAITERFLSIVPDCDLIVGTEEEIHIAGGVEDNVTALRAIRALSAATIVLKRGPLGCVVFDGDIPDTIEMGRVFEGAPVRVFNTLGAGDGFMSGFLRGWIGGEDLETCARFANSTGALVVSRNGCAPAMPSWEELQAFLSGRWTEADLAGNRDLAHLHHATTRRRNWPQISALAFDHRAQFETLAQRLGADTARISHFKDLCAQALEHAVHGIDGAGAIIDGKYGAVPLARLSGSEVWIARPVERPQSRPLAFEPETDIGLHIRTWPVDHVVKCLVTYHPDDEEKLRSEQLDTLRTLYTACLETDHELLIEVIAPDGMNVTVSTIPRALGQIYDHGIRPDWWKLPPAKDGKSWELVGDVIRERDPYCRGVVVLGLNASIEALETCFGAARQEPLCCGFAVGRTIFWDVAEHWFANEITDADAKSEIIARYCRLVEIWQSAKPDNEPQHSTVATSR